MHLVSVFFIIFSKNKKKKSSGLNMNVTWFCGFKGKISTQKTFRSKKKKIFFCSNNIPSNLFPFFGFSYFLFSFYCYLYLFWHFGTQSSAFTRCLRPQVNDTLFLHHFLYFSTIWLLKFYFSVDLSKFQIFYSINAHPLITTFGSVHVTSYHSII